MWFRDCKVNPYGSKYEMSGKQILSTAAYASIVMITGKLMFGFILGNIASTLANAEAERVKYVERLEGIKVTGTYQME